MHQVGHLPEVISRCTVSKIYFVIMDITKLKINIHNDLKEIQKWLRLTLRFNLMTLRKSIEDFSSQPRLKCGIFQI